jgi:hypothetical protein
LRGLEKAPTFLVPIINPPFADNSPHLSSPLNATYLVSLKIARTQDFKKPNGRRWIPEVSGADSGQVIGSPS